MNGNGSGNQAHGPGGRPEISVIIPAYNRASRLPHAVESILIQGMDSLEIVIADDGSRDDTRQVVERMIETHGPERIRYFYQENGGASAARNLAMSKSRGEILAFLDSDDLWVPGSLEPRLNLLRSIPEAGVVFGDAQVRRGEEVLTPSFLKERPVYERIPEAPKPVPEPFDLLMQSNFLVPSTALVRAECVRQVGGFDTNMQAVEDREFFLRLALRYPLICLHQVMAWKQVEGDNLGGNSERNARNHIYLLEKLPRINPEYAQKHRNRLQRQLTDNQAYLGRLLFFQGRGSEARHWLRRSISGNPSPSLLPYLAATYLGGSFLRFLGRLRTR